MRTFLKNLSIRIKILGPVTVMGIAMAVIGIMGILGMSRVMGTSSTITGSYIPAIEAADGINGSYQGLRRVAFAHIVASVSDNKDLMSDLSEEGDKLLASIDENLESYRSVADTQEKLDAADKFESDFSSYMETWNAIVEASGKKDIDTASNLANTDLREKGTALTESLAALGSSLEEGMENAEAMQLHAYSVSKNIIFICMGVAVLVFAFTVWVSWTWCVKRLININKQLRAIIKSIEEGQGDLTKRVQSFCTDEIATLSAGINVFIETLHKIMGQINGSSTQLSGVVETVSSKVDMANTDSSDVLGMMETLSTSMNETAASVENIGGSVAAADTGIAELAEESKKLREYAGGMQERATKMEEEATENSHATSEVVNRITESLRQAIEDSKQVEKVNSLTDEILSISAQTNLLSLNASIEAARAGDAGRGFAVVANEISGLAASSKEAASNIQEINAMIVTAVNDLVKSSDEMVQYVTDNILPDYENFVEAGKQYNDDAVRVNEAVSLFSGKSAELQEMMESITAAVGEITTTVDESARNVAGATESTSGLAGEIGEIASAMDENREVAGALKGEADRFINLDK